MEPSYHKPLHSDLPEHVAEAEIATYKYSVPDGTPPYSNVQALSSHSPYDEHAKPKIGRRSFTSWPFLVLYGVLLAIIAGVAGGFIGKTIERQNHQSSSSGLPESQSCPTALSAIPIPSATSAVPETTKSATPTSSSATFVRTIAQPTTGCSSAYSRESFKARTQFLGREYTAFCGLGWMEWDLVALSVASTSDCVESCDMYNKHKGSGDRTCVGGGFIPEWWNQSQAATESAGQPYNCFLKTNASGITRNDKKFEVVVLCLDKWCDGVLG